MNNKIMILALIIGLTGLANAETAINQLGATADTAQAAVAPVSVKAFQDNAYLEMEAKYKAGKVFEQGELAEYQEDDLEGRQMTGIFAARNESHPAGVNYPMVNGEITLNVMQKYVATGAKYLPLNINGHYFQIGLPQTEKADGVYFYRVSLSSKDMFVSASGENKLEGDDQYEALIGRHEKIILQLRKYNDELVGRVYYNSDGTYPDRREILDGYFLIPLK